MHEILERVRSRMRNERALRSAGADIAVEESEGAIRLRGAVADIKCKRRAAAIAHEESAGSVQIEDELRLRIEDPAGDGRLFALADRELRGEPVFRATAMAALAGTADTGIASVAVAGEGADGGPVAGDRDTPARDTANVDAASATTAGEGGWMRIGAHEGVVTLEGELPSLSHVRLAEVLCWWLPGIAGVRNRLRTRPPEDDNDAELSEAIRLVFDKDQRIDAQQIRTLVRNRIVRLGGVADSREQAERAERDCWYVPGVREVRNELRVIPRH